MASFTKKAAMTDMSIALELLNNTDATFRDCIKKSYRMLKDGASRHTSIDCNRQIEQNLNIFQGELLQNIDISIHLMTANVALIPQSTRRIIETLEIPPPSPGPINMPPTMSPPQPPPIIEPPPISSNDNNNNDPINLSINDPVQDDVNIVSPQPADNAADLMALSPMSTDNNNDDNDDNNNDDNDDNNNDNNDDNNNRMTPQNKKIRAKWKVGDPVQIFSDSRKKWYRGEIIEMKHDDKGEWLVIKYKALNILRVKELQRYNTSNLRIAAKLGRPKNYNRTKIWNDNEAYLNPGEQDHCIFISQLINSNDPFMRTPNLGKKLRHRKKDNNFNHFSIYKLLLQLALYDDWQDFNKRIGDKKKYPKTYIGDVGTTWTLLAENKGRDKHIEKLYNVMEQQKSFQRVKKYYNYHCDIKDDETDNVFDDNEEWDWKQPNQTILQIIKTETNLKNAVPVDNDNNDDQNDANMQDPNDEPPVMTASQYYAHLF